MKLLPMDKLGPREIADQKVEFGLYLPGITAQNGDRLMVKIINEKDQFLKDIPTKDFELNHSLDPEYSDYWSGVVAIDPANRPAASREWGRPGRYVHRFELRRANGAIDWIIDPFAREFGVGKLSAFTLGYHGYAWSDVERHYRTLHLDDLVIYELMISEFGGNIEGAIAKLDYLQDLGINCVELMPTSNVSNTVDWGYLPIGYFGVDERFGQRKDLQRFIDEAHQRGIAVILDAIYGHVSDQFPYQYLYDRLGAEFPNPMMGAFAKDYFGRSTDFAKTFTQDFFYTVNHHFLDCYHVDGFRYDCVPNYWDGAMGKGYANLTYHTFKLVKERMGQEGYYRRFDQGSGQLGLIQCAEQLEGPREILEKTYTNCTWQNGTLSESERVARGARDRVTALGFELGLLGYPVSETHNGDRVPKTALQYIENHDHQRFICHFGMLEKDNVILKEGDRSKWYKVQPYLIGLMTAKGIPLIWQGQEFGENYYIPHAGWARVMLYRPVRWDYFYDSIGRSMISLFRKLLDIRQKNPQLRTGGHYFYNDYNAYQSRGVLLFHRDDAQMFTLIALNFGDNDQTVPFTFPVSGHFREMLHGQNNLGAISAGDEITLTIPSNYGRIWTAEK